MSRAVTLYRPVGQKEHDLIEASGWRRFPPRLSFQPIFYPVIEESYAVQIARDWNTKDPASDYVGYVTRFQIDADYLSKYAPKQVGGKTHTEYWIPADLLDEFNYYLIGTIQVIHFFIGSRPPRKGQEQD
jgi:hypothetical protein